MDNASAAEANLRWLLRPIDTLLADPAMTDLYINGPGEGRCFIDRGHGMGNYSSQVRRSPGVGGVTTV